MVSRQFNVSSSDSSSETSSSASSATMRRKAYDKNEHRRIIKNLFIIGFAFTLLFSAFLATANLQSSINSEGSLGIYALATVYISSIVASLFLPPLVMYKLKIKATLVLSMVGYMGYILSQFYPHFGTLIPASAFLGICTAHLWAAKSAYVAKIAEEYAKLTNQSVTSALQKFFGIFFLCFHSAQIWGNLISSSVLSLYAETDSAINITSNSSNDFETILETTTTKPKLVSTQVCGPRFCPAIIEEKSMLNTTNETSTGIVVRPDDSKTYLLFGIFLGCSIAAAFTVLFFLDSLVRYGELELKNKGKPKATGLLIATVQHWRRPTQLLVIPMSIWLGIQEAFIGADFTLAFISCAWGVENIGFVMMCFGISACLSSLIVGKITYWIGRPTVFLIAGCLNISCMITMLTWNPNPEQFYVYFIISGLWGIADGVWSPQVKALYGAIFPDTAEAAFTNATLWIGVGFITVYLIGSKFCMSVKLYLYITLVSISIICYLLVEFIERKRTRLERLRESEPKQPNI